MRIKRQQWVIREDDFWTSNIRRTTGCATLSDEIRYAFRLLRAERYTDVLSRLRRHIVHACSCQRLSQLYRPRVALVAQMERLVSVLLVHKQYVKLPVQSKRACRMGDFGQLGHWVGCLWRCAAGT